MREIKLITDHKLSEAAFMDAETGEIIPQGQGHDDSLKSDIRLVQGFLTEDGTFVNRQDAALIAQAQHAEAAISRHPFLCVEWRRFEPRGHDEALGALPEFAKNPDVRVVYLMTGIGESLVIVDTTPWTLPANVAVAVAKEFEYAKVLAKKDGRVSSSSPGRA
jgi:hypothetical protein